VIFFVLHVQVVGHLVMSWVVRGIALVTFISFVCSTPAHANLTIKMQLHTHDSVTYGHMNVTTPESEIVRSREEDISLMAPTKVGYYHVTVSSDSFVDFSIVSFSDCPARAPTFTRLVSGTPQVAT
jgi:hypothetical protein